jgi:hypothetical protein
MRSGRALLFAVGVLTSLLWTVSAEWSSLSTLTETGQPNYPSPTAVFDAYRKALAKGDLRMAQLCLTPELIDDEVEEALFLCEMRHLVAVRTKYLGETDAVEAEYRERHMAKFGVDPKAVKDEYNVKLTAAWEEYHRKHAMEEPFGPVPQAVIEQVGLQPRIYDSDLVRTVVLGRIADKVGFVAAVCETLYGPSSYIGALRKVRMREDTAVGEATETSYGIGANGLPDRAVERTTANTIHFQKTKYGWLISGIGNDQ